MRGPRLMKHLLSIKKPFQAVLFKPSELCRWINTAWPFYFPLEDWRCSPCPHTVWGASLLPATWLSSQESEPRGRVSPHSTGGRPFPGVAGWGEVVLCSLERLLLLNTPTPNKTQKQAENPTGKCCQAKSLMCSRGPGAKTGAKPG